MKIYVLVSPGNLHSRVLNNEEVLFKVRRKVSACGKRLGLLHGSGLRSSCVKTTISACLVGWLDGWSSLDCLIHCL